MGYYRRFDLRLGFAEKPALAIFFRKWANFVAGIRGDERPGFAMIEVFLLRFYCGNPALDGHRHRNTKDSTGRNGIRPGARGFFREMRFFEERRTA